jgi:hypothetical protein
MPISKQSAKSKPETIAPVWCERVPTPVAALFLHSQQNAGMWTKPGCGSWFEASEVAAGRGCIVNHVFGDTFHRPSPQPLLALRAG